MGRNPLLTSRNRRGGTPGGFKWCPVGRAGRCVSTKGKIMDAKHLRREIAVVKQPAVKRRRQQRDDLLAQALKKHRSPGIELLLNLIEAEAGDLHVDARLRRS